MKPSEASVAFGLKLTAKSGKLTGLVVEGGGEASRTVASVFWPFPDLALLELNGWTDHVCAPLTGDEPMRRSEPHARGFGRREG